MVASTNYLPWVERAERDVRVVRAVCALCDNRDLPDVCFACKQVAEEYVKACLIRAQIEFSETNDFEVQFQAAAVEMSSIAALSDAVRRLRSLGLEGRNPVGALSETDVRQAIQDMEQVRCVCREVLGLARDADEAD